MNRSLVAILAALAVSCSGSQSPTTPTAAPLPTSAQTNLSGSWAGTVTPTIAGTVRSDRTSAVTYSFEHSGTRLTGTQIGGFVTSLNLTESQASGSGRTYTGTLVLPANREAMPGTMTVDVTAGTMAGTFAGTNTDGLAESNAYSLRKQ